MSTSPGFTIPDRDEAFAGDPQSIWMQSDVDAIVRGIYDTGVVTGCGVTPQGPPDMTVAVAAGSVVSGGALAAVAGGNATIGAADGLNPRIDVVVADSGGSLAVRAGAAAAEPKAPEATAGDVPLAFVLVPANATSIVAGYIVDKRVFRPSFSFLKVGNPGVPSNTSAGDITGARLHIGVDGALTSDRIFQVQSPTVAPAAGGFVGASFNSVGAPAAATGDTVALLVYHEVVPTASSASRSTAAKVVAIHDSGVFDLTSPTSLIGIQANAEKSVGGTIQTMTAVNGYVHITAGVGADLRTFHSTFDGAGAASVVSMQHYNIVVDALPTAMTAHRGLNVPNLGGAGVTTAVGIEIAAQSGATNNFGIRNAANMTQTGYLGLGSISPPVNVGDGDLTASRLSVADGGSFTATGYITRFGGTLTDTANGAAVAYVYGPLLSPASNSLADFRILSFSASIAPPTGVTMDTVLIARFESRFRSDATLASVIGLYANGTIIDSSSPAAWGTISSVWGIQLQPLFSLSTAKTGSVSNLYGLDIDMIVAGGASFTSITTARGVFVRDPSSAPTAMTTFIGVDISKPTRATTNIGLRNAGPTVWTPSATQDLVAGTAIVADATVARVTASGGSVTLTSAPTIAGGQDGQILIVVNGDAANSVTLQDQGTLASSNLRLSATGVTLGPRDSIILMYSSVVGDWLQIGQTNVL